MYPIRVILTVTTLRARQLEPDKNDQVDEERGSDQCTYHLELRTAHVQLQQQAIVPQTDRSEPPCGVLPANATVDHCYAVDQEQKGKRAGVESLLEMTTTGVRRYFHRGAPTHPKYPVDAARSYGQVEGERQDEGWTGDSGHGGRCQRSVRR